MASAPVVKHRRSFRGCLTCRRRKVLCGQEKPHCANCQRLGLECRGYLASLKWLQVDPAEFDTRNSTRTLLQSPADPNTGRRTLYSLDYRKRMAKELSTLLSHQNTNADLSYTLKQLDDTVQTSLLDTDSADTLFLGPFGLFSSRPLEHTSSSSPTQNSNTTTPEVVSETTTHAESPTILDPTVSINLDLCLDTQGEIPPESPVNANVTSDTHSFGHLSSHVSPLEIAPSSDGAATIDLPHFNTSCNESGSRQEATLVPYQDLVFEPNTLPAVADPLTPKAIQLQSLFNHYVSNMIHLLTPVCLPHSPYKNVILDRALRAFAALTMFGEASKLSVSTLHSLLAMAATHCESVYPSHRGAASAASDGTWSPLARQYLHLTDTAISQTMAVADYEKWSIADCQDMLITLINTSAANAITGSTNEAYTHLQRCVFILNHLPVKSREPSLDYQSMKYILLRSCALTTTACGDRIDNLGTLLSTRFWQDEEQEVGRDCWCSTRSSGELLSDMFGVCPAILHMILETTVLANELDVSSRTNSQYLGSSSIYDAPVAELEGRIFSWPSKTHGRTLDDQDIDNEDVTSQIEDDTESNDGDFSEHGIQGHHTPSAFTYAAFATEPFSDLSESHQKAINAELVNCTSQAMYNGLVLYFLRRVSGSHPAVLQQYVKDILKQANRHSKLRAKYEIDVGLLFWPVFIAGCEATDYQDRQTCLQALKRVELCGFRIAAAAIRMMESVWNDRDLGKFKASWTEYARETKTTITFI